MKLETYKRRHGLRDIDIAAVIERDVSTISRIRRGLQMPDWPTMLEIMRATSGRVKPNDFLPRR